MLDSMSLCCPGARGKCLCDNGPGGPCSPEMGNLIWLPSIRSHGCEIACDVFFSWIFFSHPDDHFTFTRLLSLWYVSYLMAIGNLRQYCTICGKGLSWRQAEARAWLGSHSRCAHTHADVWAPTALIESKPLLGLPFTNWWIYRPDLDHSGYTTPITLLYLEV